MMHLSIPKDAYCEFVEIKPIENSMYSKCQIKVCWVDDKPNRNRTVITKEVARNMANSLPGCPIVGFYNKDRKDFEEHNRTINISNGQFTIEDATRPYGFVDLNPRVWFQRFHDDDGVEREYLMTEGVIWNGVYPEAERILTHGNNQSMELEKVSGNWSFNENDKSKFFIINDAIISKLCILGEDQEPCFEGAQIRVSFSLAEDFKAHLFSLIEDYKTTVKGGKDPMILPSTFSTAVENENVLWTSIFDKYAASAIGVFVEDEINYVLTKNEDEKFYKHSFNIEDGVFSFVGEAVEVDSTYSESENLSKFDAEAVLSYSEKKKEEEEEPEDKEPPKEDPEDKGDPEEKEDPEEEPEDKKKKYNLDEVVEYQDLLTNFNDLNTKYNALVAEHEELTNNYNALNTNYTTLSSEVEGLREFKLNSERTQKEELIGKFYMLSEEDKDNVIKNIDTYSLDDIEKELSVICFRKKISFGLETPENKENKDGLTYNLNNPNTGNSLPAWVQAVVDVSREM